MDTGLPLLSKHPTTLLCDALPLCFATPAPRMNHRATSGLVCWKGTLSVWHAQCVWSVLIWTRRPTPAPASLLPLATPTAQITAVAQCYLAVPFWLALRKCCGDQPFAHLCVCVWGGGLQPLLASQCVLSAKKIQICREKESCLWCCMYEL